MSAGVDLHMHSTCSDGLLEPAALMAFVASCGVRACALTDHDTTAGLAAAASAARAHGLEFIPGIELSARWRSGTIHVLGLGIAADSDALATAIAALATLRAGRALEIRARLDRAGAPGSAAFARIAPDVVPTLMHFARELVALGAVPDVQAAFTRWLGRARPAQVPTAWPELADTIDAIRAAGGVAVLAHPLRYRLSAGQRRALVRAFKAAGGTGLEVAVGGAAPRQVEAATGLALRCGLEGSAGSDCHDPSLPWHRPGRLAKLPDALVPVWNRWLSTNRAAFGA